MTEETIPRTNITVTRDEIFSDFNNVKSIYKIKYYVNEPALDFNILLYVPESTSDLVEEQNIKKGNIKLCIENNLTIENYEGLLPNYLSFLEGVIYSDDLPLSMFCEGIQNSESLNLIRNIIVTKCLEYFRNLSSTTIYEQFYKTYSRNIKLGIYEDRIHRNQLAQLLRYHTSVSGSEMCSLQDYVYRMKENQIYIYFITGTTIKQIEDSVFIESLKKNNIEVIYMIDPIDEFIMEVMHSFNGKPLISVMRNDLAFLENETQREIQVRKTEFFAKLCTAMKEVLGDKVDKVVVSNRLVESPCCIVSLGNGLTSDMERIVNSQILYEMPMRQSTVKKQFEINPDHIVIQLLSMKILIYGLDARSNDFIIFLFETALISSGFFLEKPQLFINKYINVHSIFEKTFDIAT